MSTGTDDRRQKSGLQIWQQVAVFLFACAVLILRRPDAVFHAQFFAEDGRDWLADAYNLGWWQALFHPYNGYFQTFPRLGAAFALLAPLALAPLVMNLFALAAQAIPVNLLLSSRSSAWGSLRSRALLAILYLALPNCAEIGVVITESQWLMTLSAFLLIVASGPQGRAARCFDITLILLSGLTGPFCIFLLPIAIFVAWKRPDPWRWAPACVLAGCSLVQACGLLILAPSARPHCALGANFSMLTRIFGGDVILGALLGANTLATMPGSGAFLFLTVAAVSGMAIVVTCFLKSAMEMRLFLLLSATIFVAGLVFPTTKPPAGVSVWQALAMTAGVRYWFFGTLAFAWSLLWCFQSRIALFKIVSAFFLLLMCFGIVRDWRRPAFADMHFAEYARRFDAAPAGTAVTFPENPRGWNFRLVKHRPGE